MDKETTKLIKDLFEMIKGNYKLIKLLEQRVMILEREKDNRIRDI